MKKVSVFFQRLYSWSVYGLGLLFLAGLSGISYFITAYMSNDDSEITYYLHSPIFIFALYTLLALILLFIAYRVLSIKISERLFFRGVLCLVLLCCVVLCTTTYAAVMADQSEVYRIAQNFVAGDYSDFGTGTYLGLYPQQDGIILIVSLLYRLFGRLTVVAFRLCNCLFVLLLLYVLHEICRDLFHSDQVCYVYDLLALFCFPLFLYTTFFYGNIISTTLCALAIFMQMRYFHRGKKRYMVICAASTALAIMIKSNSLICFVAIIPQYLFHIDKQVRWRLAGIGLILAAHVGLSLGVDLYFQSVTGVKAPDGLPKTSWIGMGLRDGPMASGWYRQDYPDIFSQSGFDADVANEKYTASIKNSVQTFINDPGYAVSFFAHKTASQWNNPSFQGFWIQRHRQSIGICDRFIDDGTAGRNLLNNFMDIYEFLVYGGSLLALILLRRNWKTGDHTIILAFVGGFLFHLVWEAKGQYALQYFVMLLPYAAYGITAIHRSVQKVLSKNKKPSDPKAYA